MTGHDLERSDVRGARLVRRVGAWAAIVGPTIFVVTFTVEGWLRPDYSATAMFVSALALGSSGWIQILNFVIVGLSFLALARGVAARFPTGTASRAAPIVLRIIGLSLIGSGPFVMDPAGMSFPERTLHGEVHQLLGALVFSLGPASAFVLFRRFRSEPGRRAMAGWSLAAGIIMLAAVVVLKAATLPPPASPNALTAWVGLIQRVAIVTLMSWVVSVGVRLLRSSDGQPGR
jgi:hypothetical protein